MPRPRSGRGVWRVSVLAGGSAAGHHGAGTRYPGTPVPRWRAPDGVRSWPRSRAVDRRRPPAREFPG